VPIVAELTKVLGLKGNSPESANAARNKILMRELLNQENVNCPKSMCFYNIEDIQKSKNNFAFPLIIKPPNMTSSKFVRLVNNFDDLIEASNEIFQAINNVLNYPVIKAVLIEEYVTGPEFSIELFLDDKICKFASVTEKRKCELPNFVELAHIVPSSITNSKQNQDLITVAYKAAMAIGLEYGPVHVEIVFGENGPSIIELAGRIGGDRIMFLVELASKVCLPSLAIQQVFNSNIDNMIDNIFYQGAAIRYLTATPGKVIDILGVDKIKLNKNVMEINMNIKVGDYINPLLSSADRVGYIIATGKDSNEAYQTACELANEIKISTF
jgi:biotin carboxylase